ncbi:malonyl-CoA decarboxylase [Pararhizobium sp. YC-54]|uniref:malonyl-CoA decarboxylase n=1 Tax=Pararhizobium sp. YC-54 TaxID=2986920 RepID=UPI0021F7E283|nr:malonyl-CoA decarboxylase [Pararhizobium sp. YC-54]MCW0000745.1 malonyl-CoA decarboxylase [Pararhizobium sp. YC-54]
MNTMSSFRDMIDAIAERGRRLIAPSPPAQKDAGAETLVLRCEELLSSKGEASGLALAQDILSGWARLNDQEQREFMCALLERFGAGAAHLGQAIKNYSENPNADTLSALHDAAEPRRQELIRRLNAAPQGTASLVRMREVLLHLLPSMPELAAVDADFAHLFASWFNRGFLQLRSIDWMTPAHILEKIIHYEAVHAIGDWNELRSRLAPPDRRCFAFFHPQLADEPLIFVEVALTRSIPDRIGTLLDDARAPIAPGDADTAVFYSISNCQQGLRGISFGNFLIKQVVEDLRREQPGLKNFVTLSPVPGFARWLKAATDETEVLEFDRLKAVLDGDGWSQDEALVLEVQPLLLRAAAQYFLNARTTDGRPVDPVARFHLGNGARLERLDFLGNVSARALRESHCLMVNYLYKLDDIERNHEAYAERGEVVASSDVRKWLSAQSFKKPAKPREKTHA